MADNVNQDAAKMVARTHFPVGDYFGGYKENGEVVGASYIFCND